jgi:hypothetical protein
LSNADDECCAVEEVSLQKKYLPLFSILLLTQEPKAKKSEWLGDRDLNPDKQIQSLLYCRCTIPQHKGK